MSSGNSIVYAKYNQRNGDVEGKAGYQMKEMDPKRLSKTYRMRHSTNKFPEQERCKTQFLSPLLCRKAIMWACSSLAQDELNV